MVILGKKIGEIDEFGKRFLYKEKKNILITGITGSLGRTLCKNLINNNNYNIFGIYNSEQKFAHFKRNKQFKSIKCFKLNISDITFESKINYIIKDNQINYLIHSAAMKHVDICEENQIEAVNTNIIASEILIKCCKLNNVTNMIGLSTDKTIEPCNIYGYSKLMMQNIILKNGYSIYQGANFFWSDGSVLDIWMNQMNKKKPLTVTNLNHQRYFNTLNFVSDLLVKNLDTKNTIILPESVYLIKIEDLLYAFMEYFNYNNYNIIGSESVEKNIEQLDDTISNRISINKDEIKELIKEYFD